MTVSVDQTIAACYVAFFGRSPDQQGLQYWEQVAQNSGLSGIALTESIAAGFANNPSFASTYGTLGNAAFVDAIYQNIGGTAPDAAGAAYWTNLLNNGESRAKVVGDFVYGVLNMSAADIQTEVTNGTITAAEATDALQRQQYLLNRSDVALTYTTAMGAGSDMAPTTNQLDPASLANDPAYQASQAILNNVTADPATVTAANTYLSSGTPTSAGIIATFGGNVATSTFTLTTGVDNLTGVAGDNNVFYAVLDAANSTPSYTLNAGDVINGGTGSNNTLDIVVTGNPTINLATETITNIQNLVINSADGYLNQTINLPGSNGFSSVTVVNPDYVTVQGINEGASATVQAAANGSSAYAKFDFNSTTATSVTMNDTVTGAAGVTDYTEGDFYHGEEGAGLANATTINATLNVQNASIVNGGGEADGYQDIYAENAGNKGAAITANVNMTNLSTDGSNEYHEAETDIYQTGDAVVTANINMTNASGWAEVDANDNNGVTADPTKNVANITLNNVSAGYGDTGVEASGFDTVNVNVTGNAVLDDGLYFYENDSTATSTNSQTVTINASANLTSAETELDESGSTHLVVTGSGNVNLGTYDGTSDTLSATVTSTIDASALTGNLTVVLDTEISSFIGGSGNNALLATSYGSIAAGATIDGGVGGMNTISASLVNAGDSANIKDFQILDVDGFGNSAGNGVLDASLLSSSVSGVAISSTGTDGTATLLNLGANVTVTDSTVNTDSDLVLTHAGTGTNSLAVNFESNSTTGDGDIDSIVSTGDTTVSISSDGVATAVTDDYNVLGTLAETDNVLTKVSVKGATFFELDHVNTNTGAMTATADVASSLKTIDASATTGGVSIEAGYKQSIDGTYYTTYTGLTIHGGTGGDEITNGADNGVIVEGATAATVTQGYDSDTGFANTLTVTGSHATINDSASAATDDLFLNGFSDSATLGSGKGVSVTVADDTFDTSGAAKLGDVATVTLGTGTATITDNLLYNAVNSSTTSLNTNGDILALNGTLHGETISFANVANTATTLGAASSVAGAQTFDQAVYLADHQTGVAAHTVVWFQYAGNTYVEATGATSTTDAHDAQLVKIAGTVDLSHATVSAANHAITFA
ncbi:hypothetical protein OKW45_008069 [Paraburkholderia sp. WSM4175]|uniref:beta strand repeat-containing protein n=1 Tax=Paraburkholderia sp. WSM4175 TaxID=2991072 RepID=UPI003D256342